ncbi:MAG: precorrin-6Y C5,15-methyltransferase (decarboxylating) subunit CbiT [Bacillota bacterium]
MADFPYVTPGIPDGLFLRGGAPLTREEIRVVVLAKLRLMSGGVLWDIGAGTGSVAIEAARLMPGDKVFAVEARPERAELIAANRERFGVENLVVVPGEAPEVLQSLPQPDRVFIGGSGGRLPEILSFLSGVLPVGGRLAVSAVTLETLREGLAVLDWPGWNGETISLTLARGEKLGKARLLRGENPVFLVVAERQGS